MIKRGGRWKGKTGEEEEEEEKEEEEEGKLTVE